jgi:hypothetical protein
MVCTSRLPRNKLVFLQTPPLYVNTVVYEAATFVKKVSIPFLTVPTVLTVIIARGNGLGSDDLFPEVVIEKFIKYSFFHGFKF